jgi:TrmH family RNA methyltransferase
VELLSKNKIKLIRSLQAKKNRDSESFFVVEGEKMVEELLRDNPALVEFVVTTLNNSSFDRCYQADERSMKEISSLKTPSSLLAVVRKLEVSTSTSNFVLALDGIQDPGNLGTIIRTADWFGVDRIVCSLDTVDCYNPKVVQATMGSIFRVAVEYTDLTEFLASSELPIYGALLNGKNLYETELQIPSILLIGNEGKGISPSAQAHIDHPVFIPSYGKAESLNASMATGILLAEFRRLA